MTTERAFDLINALAEAADATGLYDDSTPISDIRAELRRTITDNQWNAECAKRGISE